MCWKKVVVLDMQPVPITSRITTFYFAAFVYGLKFIICYFLLLFLFFFPFIFYIIHPSSLCLFFHIVLFIIFGCSLSFSEVTV